MYYTGRQGYIGIGIETVNGTTVPQTDFIPYVSEGIIGKHTPLAITDVHGIRDQEFGSVQGKKLGEGKLDTNLDPYFSGYFFKMALGTETMTTISGTVTQHVFSLSPSAIATSASLYIDKGGYIEVFPFSIMKDLEIDVKDGLAALKTNILSQFPTTTTSGVVTSKTVTQFSFKDMTAQFGSNMTAALAAPVYPMTAANIKMTGNPETIYQVGSQTPIFAMNQFGVTGEFDTIMTSTLERDNYYNLIKNAMVYTFTGANLGGTNYEKIMVKIYSSRVEDVAVETGIDKVFSYKSKFIGEYSLSDAKTCDVTVINNKQTVY